MHLRDSLFHVWSALEIATVRARISEHVLAITKNSIAFLTEYHEIFTTATSFVGTRNAKHHIQLTYQTTQHMQTENTQKHTKTHADAHK
jgi:hypothetical protein